MLHQPTDSPSTEPIPELEKEILRQEYFFLQATIEDYNKQIWIIKALCITGTGAAIGLTIQQKQPLIALTSCALPLFFWILESQWKHFQHGFYPRVLEIEKIFSDEFKFSTPGIYSGWNRVFKRHNTPKRRGYLWDGLFNPSVFISYVLEFVFLVFVSMIQIP